MIQGTNSNAGKSLLVAGLCRVFAREGLVVHPFKPQNMSNNAAVADDGEGEIGRAQALQALAAQVPTSVHHNPVLLKPESDTGAQVIVQGRPRGRLDAHRFGHRRDELLPAVLDSFDRLRAIADLVVIEGAGSPAETNLRAGEIANMGFAAAAGVPVILAGDIDRGGVIASLVGTHKVLSPDDGRHVKGFLINKFRGDVGLFDDGLATVSEHTGWPSMGVVTWFNDAARLPAEDAVELTGSPGDGSLRIAVPMLSRIANFDDLDPLGLEPGVDVVMVPPGSPLPVCDLVLIPGTKATIADLGFFREQGWHTDLSAHVRRGGRVIGLCGGYQMLGRTIADSEGVEGPPETVDGLGLLDVHTELTSTKSTEQVTGRHRASGEAVDGYEIHVGTTTGPDAATAWLELTTGAEGATSANGRIVGSYVHGVFAADGFRQAFLADLGVSSSLDYGADVEATLDRWADHLESCLAIDQLLSVARSPV